MSNGTGNGIHFYYVILVDAPTASEPGRNKIELASHQLMDKDDAIREATWCARRNPGHIYQVVESIGYSTGMVDAVWMPMQNDKPAPQPYISNSDITQLIT